MMFAQLYDIFQPVLYDIGSIAWFSAYFSFYLQCIKSAHLPSCYRGLIFRIAVDWGEGMGGDPGSKYVECWPGLPFDILLYNYFPAG